MTTDASRGALPTPPDAPASWLGRASAWVSRTPPTTSALERRQARLVAWLIVASVLLGTASGLLYQLMPGQGPSMSAQAWVVIASITALLGFTFWLNRSGHSRWAAWLVVLLFSLATWGIVLADQPNYVAQPELRVELLFPLLPILIGGLLLPAWATGLWAAGNVLALAAFASVYPLSPSFTFQGLAVFYVFVSLLSALAGELRRRDMQQVDAQTRALADSEAEYRRIVDLAQEGIWILDAGNITRFVNRKMADLLGYTEAEMIGVSAFEFMDDAGRAIATASLERRRAGLVESHDFKFLHKDGSERWVILANAPMTDAAGSYAGAISLVTDVTQRREAENRLRASQALFHSAFAFAAIGMSVVDMDGRYVQVNNALCRLVGYTEAELLATTYHHITHPDDQQAEQDNAARLLAGEISSYQVEKRYRHKLGHLIWVLISVSLVHDEAGRPTYSVAQIQDISAHKRDSESLRENSERYRQMLAEAQALRQFNDSIAEVMAEALILEDAAGSITLVNPKLLAMLGYSAAELIGLNATNLVAERDKELVRRHTAQRARGITSRYEATLVTKDGRELPVLVSATPLTKDDKFAGTLATLTDISSRMQAEAALKEANSRLTAGLAESEKRTREIALLNEMGEMLQTSLAPDEAYAVVAQMMPGLFSGSAGRVYLIKESRNVVEAVAQWGPAVGEALPFTPNECWGLRRGRLHAMEQLNGVPSAVICPHLTPPWPASYICVPMVAQGETVGVLHLQHIETEGAEAEAGPYWTVARQQLARTVADSVGLALANLRLRDSLRQQSIRDPLTGLYNRRYLEETLERELSRAGREKQTVGVVMIDIDHFKQFNDAWGHEAGDRLLRDFGALLRTHIRGGDIACRYGGEEFTLILPSVSREVIGQRVQNLLNSVNSLAQGGAAPAGQTISISVGIALFPHHGSDGGELMRAADTALYQAKHDGRNRMSMAAGRPGELVTDAPAAP